MQKPKKTQIEEISIENTDKIILPIDIQEEKEKNFFEKLCEDIVKILD